MSDINTVIPNSWLCPGGIVLVNEDTVTRLLSFVRGQMEHCKTAADRIEQLESQLANARNEALDRAAGICDGIEDDYHKREHMKFPEMKTDAEACARECAYAIRALKDKT